jgi:hypothetical protein
MEPGSWPTTLRYVSMPPSAVKGITGIARSTPYGFNARQKPGPSNLGIASDSITCEASARSRLVIGRGDDLDQIGLGPDV